LLRKSLYGKIASLKTCAKRKTKGMFLVKVFTEGKKVVGKAFLSKERFLVKICVICGYKRR
jgi:hypothetical protein